MSIKWRKEGLPLQIKLFNCWFEVWCIWNPGGGSEYPLWWLRGEPAADCCWCIPGVTVCIFPAPYIMAGLNRLANSSNDDPVMRCDPTLVSSTPLCWLDPLVDETKEDEEDEEDDEDEDEDGAGAVSFDEDVTIGVPDPDDDVDEDEDDDEEDEDDDEDGVGTELFVPAAADTNNSVFPTSDDEDDDCGPTPTTTTAGFDDDDAADSTFPKYPLISSRGEKCQFILLLLLLFINSIIFYN